jgi:hypothetical protein
MSFGFEGQLMEFAFLTFPEVEGAAIRWDESATKSPELVAAALAAGFSEWEIRKSPVGRLERDFGVGAAGASRPVRVPS